MKNRTKNSKNNRTDLKTALASVSAGLLISIGALAAANQIDDDYGSGGGQPGTTPQTTPTPTASPMAGIQGAGPLYVANLNPTNVVDGTASAVVRIFQQGNQAAVIVEGQGFSPGVEHLQHIHSGTRCADFTDDANADGYIDITEAQAAGGSPVVPLSFNLASNAGAAGGSPLGQPGQFPIAYSSGEILYASTANLSTFASLGGGGQQPGATPSPGTSPSPTPDVTILPFPQTTNTPETSTNPPGSAGQNSLSMLAGKVIEIHGISPDITLPDTVQSIAGLPANATLPVACGVLQFAQQG